MAATIQDAESVYETVRNQVKKGELTLEGIQHCYVPVQDDTEKPEIVLSIHEGRSFEKAVIFCASTQQVEDLLGFLSSRATHFSAAALFVGLDENERESTLDDFMESEIRILVATEPMAKWVEVHRVDLVINFTVPRKESYVHHVGSRGGDKKKGPAAINIATEEDLELLQEIEEFYSTTIRKIPSDAILVHEM
ncbi:translation initiation factor eIF4A [Gryganskiella cystojenkinii]|nr:translation initiation factor eIF4A [Gryganskiella cystojenkinii]